MVQRLWCENHASYTPARYQLRDKSSAGRCASSFPSLAPDLKFWDPPAPTVIPEIR